MNLGIKVVLFFAEIGLIGGMLYLFNEVMNWIQPNFIVYHTQAYVLAALIWSAIPALALLGLIIKYTRKDEQTYTGGYF